MLSNKTSSIPLIRVKPKNKEVRTLIIFSHGNGSDLSQSIYFIRSLTSLHEAEYIAYDYSGYGESKVKDTTPQSICNDLETVVAWADRPLSEVILIGFSLGCYPTAKVASKYKVKGVILISPMMSLLSLLADEKILGINSFFKND